MREEPDVCMNLSPSAICMQMQRINRGRGLTRGIIEQAPMDKHLGDPLEDREAEAPSLHRAPMSERKRGRDWREENGGREAVVVNWWRWYSRGGDWRRLTETVTPLMVALLAYHGARRSRSCSFHRARPAPPWKKTPLPVSHQLAWCSAVLVFYFC